MHGFEQFPASIVVNIGRSTMDYVLKRRGEKHDRLGDNRRQDGRQALEDYRERHNRSYKTLKEVLDQARKFAHACLLNGEPIEVIQDRYGAMDIRVELAFWCRTAKQTWQYGKADPLCQLNQDVEFLMKSTSLFVPVSAHGDQARNDFGEPMLTPAQAAAAERILDMRLIAMQEVDRQFHTGGTKRTDHIPAERSPRKTRPRKDKGQQRPKTSGRRTIRLRLKRRSRVSD